MKKIFAIILTLLLTVGCATKQETTTTESKKVDPSNQTVTIWHTYTKAQEEALKASAERFNSLNTLGIKVVLEQQERNDFASKVMQAVRNGVGPDIIIDYATTAADYAKDGLVVDFNKYIDDAEYGIPGFRDTVSKGTLKEVTGFSDGGMYVFPLVQSGPIFFYNKDIYEELKLNVPTTWEELEANAAAVKKAYPDKYGFAFDSLADGAQTLIAQINDGVILDAENLKTNFDNEKVHARFQWFGDNVKNGNFMLAPTGQYFSEDFNSGILASYIGSVAGLPYITVENVGVAPLPQTVNGTAWTPAWNRSAIVFTSDENRQLAAFLFVKHFASAYENAQFSIACNYTSPLSTTQADADYQAFISSNVGLQQLNAEIASTYAPLAGTMTLRTGLEGAMKAVASGEKDAATAVKDVAAEADEAISSAYSR